MKNKVVHEISFRKEDSAKVIAGIAVLINELDPEKEYILSVEEVTKKRSISANNYAWSLIDKLAFKLNKSKTEIYRSYVREIGCNSYLVCCVNDAVEDLRKNWGNKGIGWISECEDSKLPGCTNVRLYYGSSVYDTLPMSRLIELIVQDCREQGIPTCNEDELQRLCDEWEVE